MGELSHFDDQGRAIMVDVSHKAQTEREALAAGRIIVSEEVLEKIAAGTVAKGDVLGIARIAGIMAAKKTSELIPLCHPLPLSFCELDFTLHREAQCYLQASCRVKTAAQTGVEMEALTGVQVALLTIYDMCKALDKRMVISSVHLVEKTGGKSGRFQF